MNDDTVTRKLYNLVDCIVLCFIIDWRQRGNMLAP